MKEYDIGIIGAGPAGYTAALKASQAGKKVCVIEENKEKVGGVCLNRGCIPTKSLIYSTGILESVKTARECGIDIEVKNVNMTKIINCSRQAATKLRKGLLYLFKKNGIDLIEGIGRVIDGDKIEIALGSHKPHEKIKVENIIIATGSIPKLIHGIIPDGKNIVTSLEALNLDYLSQKVLIIGGGAIGVEFATIYNNLGLEVKIVELMESLVLQEDEEISKLLQKSFNNRGIKVFLNAKIESVMLEEGAVIANIEKENGKEKIRTDLVLSAVGRVPNIKNLGLEGLGVKLEKDKFIGVNKNMQTTIPNIYAIGDVINSPMLAHVAFKEADVALGHILGGTKDTIDYENIPNAIYSEPEIGSLGLTESEVKKQGYKYKVKKYFYKANGRAVANKKENGLVKIIVDTDSNKILGAHIIGTNATEMINEYVIAKQNNIDIDNLLKTVHAHPTFSEMIVDVFKDVL